MTKPHSARGRSEAILARARFAALDAAGIDPRDVGKVFNRAAPPVADDLSDVTIPSTPSELEEMMADRKTIARVFSNGNKAQEFIHAYAKAVLKKDADIAAQVREQVQLVSAEYFAKLAEEEGIEVPGRLDLRNARPLAGGAMGSDGSAIYNPKAMGAILDKDFADSGDFFRTIWHHSQQTAEIQNKRTKARNAFSSNVPSEGGFLIPETLRSEMLRVSLETSIVRPRARVIPMETLRIPFPAIDATSNVSSVFGGVVAYWTEEGAALTASSASFGRVVLEAKKLTAYTEIPNELLSDSIGSFMAFIDQIFPQAIGWYEDIAFLKGTGVGEPLGMLSTVNPALIAVAKEGGQTATTIVWENIIRMYARMLPESLNRAIWLVSPDTFPELATMALSVGTGGSAVWLTNGTGGPPMTILGRPVYVTEKTPGVLGAQGDISFVDPAMYLIGDRQAMSASSSEHYKFGNDVTAYRIIERVDGRPWLQSAITPQNNGATLSPFVQLAVRA
jgi:HK97 family phage major capsid protein